MSNLTSSIGRVEDALIAALKTHATILAGKGRLVPTPVCAGYPDGGPNDEHIFTLGLVDDWDQEFDTSAGNVSGQIIGSKNESYTLRARILTRANTKDGYRAARDRALALLGALEDTCRTNFTLTGTCQLAQLTGGIFVEQLESNHRDVGIEARIRIVAWLGDPA